MHFQVETKWNCPRCGEESQLANRAEDVDGRLELVLTVWGDHISQLQTAVGEHACRHDAGLHLLRPPEED